MSGSGVFQSVLSIIPIYFYNEHSDISCQITIFAIRKPTKNGYSTVKIRLLRCQYRG